MRQPIEKPIYRQRTHVESKRMNNSNGSNEVLVYYDPRKFLRSVLWLWTPFFAISAVLFFYSKDNAALFDKVVIVLPVAAGLFAILSVFYFLDFIKYCKYSLWSKCSLPYIAMTADSISFYGSLEIPWNEVTKIESRIFMSGKNRWTSLVVEMSPQCMARIKGNSDFSRVISDNWWIDAMSVSESEGGNVSDKFIAVRIADPYRSSIAAHLTVSANRIAEFAKIYYESKPRIPLEEKIGMVNSSEIDRTAIAKTTVSAGGTAFLASATLMAWVCLIKYIVYALLSEKPKFYSSASGIGLSILVGTIVSFLLCFCHFIVFRRTYILKKTTNVGPVFSFARKFYLNISLLLVVLCPAFIFSACLNLPQELNSRVGSLIEEKYRIVDSARSWKTNCTITKIENEKGFTASIAICSERSALQKARVGGFVSVRSLKSIFGVEIYKYTFLD